MVQATYEINISAPYKSQFWANKITDERKAYLAEMRMLRWIVKRQEWIKSVGN